jgi:uncharacterized coiled-coil protein SlyX
MSESDRLINLELLFTHLERQLGELNQVVLDQAEQIELLQRQIRVLQAPPEEPTSDDEL